MANRKFDFKFDGKISFNDVLRIYRDIVSIGFKFQSEYALKAYNMDKGIKIFSNQPYDEYSLEVSVADCVDKTDLASFLSGMRSSSAEGYDFSLFGCEDGIVSIDPKVIHLKEPGIINPEDILCEESTYAEAHKQPYPISVGGKNNPNLESKFFQSRSFFCTKENDIYLVRLLADSDEDLEHMKMDLFQILLNKPR